MRVVVACWESGALPRSSSTHHTTRYCEQRQGWYRRMVTGTNEEEVKQEGGEEDKRKEG